jgi:hypothetical protein
MFQAGSVKISLKDCICGFDAFERNLNEYVSYDIHKDFIDSFLYSLRKVQLENMQIFMNDKSVNFGITLLNKYIPGFNVKQNRQPRSNKSSEEWQTLLNESEKNDKEARVIYIGPQGHTQTGSQNKSANSSSCHIYNGFYTCHDNRPIVLIDDDKQNMQSKLSNISYPWIPFVKDGIFWGSDLKYTFNNSNRKIQSFQLSQHSLFSRLVQHHSGHTNEITHDGKMSISVENCHQFLAAMDNVTRHERITDFHNYGIEIQIFGNDFDHLRNVNDGYVSFNLRMTLKPVIYVEDSSHEINVGENRKNQSLCNWELRFSQLGMK